jgi:K+/H+ antiporter YhaU regulatory subunit KhtT
MESVRVLEGSAADGASPVSLHLRSETGALVVALRRSGDLHQTPDPSAAFEAGDDVYLVGTSDAIRRAVRLFASREAG